MDSTRLLRIQEVSEKTTLAKSTIWRKLSQDDFPKPARLSPSLIVWKESDIDMWIDGYFHNGDDNV